MGGGRETQGAWRERQSIKTSIVGEREEKKKNEMKRETEMRKRGFLLKGDNKEPLKEQMKMSFLLPPLASPSFVLWRDNEGEREKVRENKCFST